MEVTAPRHLPGATPLLEVRKLAVSFGAARPVSDVSLTVYPGQTVAVVGESGSGKSLTAFAVLGLLPGAARISQGRILVSRRDGEVVDTVRADERVLRELRGGTAAMVFQEPMTCLNPLMTIADQIAEAVRLHASDRPVRQTVIQALEAVGIDDPPRRMKQYPHEFSGGMRQRVMIAMALACSAKLLVADEPTTALDVTIKRQVLDLIRSNAQERGMGVVLISHDLGIVRQYADVVCVMYAGRVLEYGTKDQVLSRPLHPYTRALMACTPQVAAWRPRLSTVPDVIGRDAAPVPSDRGTLLTPWWPTHAPPDGARSAAEPCVLARVGELRWIGAWNQPGIAESMPDVRPGAGADRRI